MVLQNYPPCPSFPALRLASPHDVPRLGVVSALGFQDSEIFKFERPGYEQFPEDAFASWRNAWRSSLADPKAITLVIEDDRLPNDDDSKYYDESREPGCNQPQEPTSRVIVGVCSWKLQKGSQREGQFCWQDNGYREPALDRDLDQSRLRRVNEVKDAGERKYFKDMPICEKLVVHPIYWHRGHGTNLLKWGLALSKMDGISQGVMPSHMGERIYAKLGFEQIDTLWVKGDKGAEGFHISVAVYDPEP